MSERLTSSPNHRTCSLQFLDSQEGLQKTLGEAAVAGCLQTQALFVPTSSLTPSGSTMFTGCISGRGGGSVFGQLLWASLFGCNSLGLR